MSSHLTRFSKSIVRHLPSLNLVVKFDEDGISIRAYRHRKWKRVMWAQIASLADDQMPLVQACENKDGLYALLAMGAKLGSCESYSVQAVSISSNKTQKEHE
jgi:hypothetical protein